MQYGAAKLTSLQLSRLRTQAVGDAWRLEQRLYLETGQTTIPRNLLSPAQLGELATKGKISGFEGHHINNVKNFPELAGDPRNIQFVGGRSGHLDAHGGNFASSTTGALIDRSAGGTLPPITLRGGRDIVGSATTEFLGFTAGLLGAVGAAAGYLDYIDPLTYIFHSPEAGAGSGIVPGSGAFNGGPAGGGFLLYPNKSNTNMMRSVYSK